jgi:RsiW-degrading membrane proteinase PrsW (M82 family)
MSSQIGKNGIVPETREARGEWLSAVSLVFFLTSTTVLEARIVKTQGLLSTAVPLPCLIFIQAYVVWYYFKRFRPRRKVFAIYRPVIAGSYSWLFVLAMVGTSVVALVGAYLLKSPPTEGRGGLG